MPLGRGKQRINGAGTSCCCCYCACSGGTPPGARLRRVPAPQRWWCGTRMPGRPLLRCCVGHVCGM